jgi:hypothetical protein
MQDLHVDELSDAEWLPTSREALPKAVQRYFAFALPPSTRRIARAHIDWSGKMRLKRGGRALSFTAQQEVVVSPREFVWNAKMSVFPGVHIHVRDGYEGGRGTTTARLAGIFPLVEQRGTPETAESALQRFLGESIWFPTALLPSAGVVWKEVDAHCATATLYDRGNRTSLDFHFNDRGEIVACSAFRWRDVGTRSALTLWHTRMWNYQAVDGIMIPCSADAQWFLPDGPLTYWHGTIKQLTCEYDPGESIRMHGLQGSHEGDRAWSGTLARSAHRSR